VLHADKIVGAIGAETAGPPQEAVQRAARSTGEMNFGSPGWHPESGIVKGGEARIDRVVSAEAVVKRIRRDRGLTGNLTQRRKRSVNPEVLPSRSLRTARDRRVTLSYPSSQAANR